MRRHRRRLRGGILGLLLAVAAAVPASAGWREDYVSGIQSVDKSRWSDVAAAMEAAIADNPRADGKTIRIYGMRFEPYIPHFYLGLARFRLGDCDGALAAWEISLSHGVVQGTARSSELERLRQDCLGRRPTPAPAVPTARPTVVPTPAGPDPARLRDAIRDAEAELGAAAAALERTRSLRGEASFAGAWRADRSLADDQQRAETALEGARSRFERARDAADLAGLAEATQAASQARAALEGLPTRLEAARAAEERQRRDAAAPTATAPPRATPTAVLPTPTPVPPLPTARPGGPPPELVAAAAAYLAGEPGRAVELLERPDVGTERASAVAHLVRAASYWMLYREGGDSDSGLRAKAAADVARCRALDRRVAPVEDAFAADFVEFFRQSG